jgi:hypothetical protein
MILRETILTGRSGTVDLEKSEFTYFETHQRNL